ncbi:cytochrome p450 [Hirsutella rhossiliensis]|uniref:Cytochrome p450 domain-containing protein n=1 Tax=Hirsutella rhossiliensis TaxID=111463 RepID=A0A9P8SLT9_9HYPO|nr:cytochrome p450 domain-containing protein [Hirsutella rhossiliensis]KAH0967863.1 cytochrome p450 domain-containing protein [Hirsutella rhossiliensis]
MFASVQALGLLLVVVIGLLHLRRLTSLAHKQDKDDTRILKTQPVFGIREERFRWVRARLRSFTETSKWAFEGYEKYCKVNLPFAIPSLEHGLTVVIPPQQIKKVYGLSESVLDVKQVQHENMQLRWTFPDPHLHAEQLHITVVRNQLTQNIPILAPRVAAEIEFGFERSWGYDGEWNEVRTWSSALRIIAGAANGAFCGLPLCRDVVFLDRLRDHAMSLFGGAIAMSCLPSALQRVFGPILMIVSRFMAERVMKRSRPIVRERLENTARLKADPDHEWTPPQDALQWIIDECYASPNREQLDLGRVCERLLIANDISLLTTAFTAQNFILDLYSSDPARGYVDALREECADVLRESGGKWTPDAVENLRLVDAAIRESMRISPLGSVLLPRKVLDPDGIVIGGWSVPVPRGTRIVVPVEPIHYDAKAYPEAHLYNPFRFVQPADNDNNEVVTWEKKQSFKVKSTVTLDESFLAFGVPGRNACPGRFFALLELKIFVANLLLNYEVEYLKSRPKPVHMMWVKYPSDANIRIRRRAGR